MDFSSITAAKLQRVKQVVHCLWTHDLIDIKSSLGLNDLLFGDNVNSSRGIFDTIAETHGEPEAQDAAIEAEQKAQKLIGELREMGPTFVRIGQLLSKRPDLLPAPYMKTLDSVEPTIELLPYDLITQTIETEFHRPFSEMFRTFEMTPFAVSPFDQTHKATVPGGKPVLVKVRRPGIVERVDEDMSLMDELAPFLDQHGAQSDFAGFTNVLSDLRKLITAELDYDLELRNLRTLKSNLSKLDRIDIPSPLETLCSSNILTIEYIEGRAIDRNASVGLLAAERRELAGQLFSAYLQQLLIDGVVHGDPEPNNLILTNSAHIALLETQVVIKLSSELQEKFIQLLLAIYERRAAQASAILLPLCRYDHDTDKFREEFEEHILTHQSSGTNELELGSFFMGLALLARRHQVCLPSELTLLGITFCTLDRVANNLDPSFDAHFWKATLPILCANM